MVFVFEFWKLAQYENAENADIFTHTFPRKVEGHFNSTIPTIITEKKALTHHGKHTHHKILHCVVLLNINMSIVDSKHI